MTLHLTTHGNMNTTSHLIMKHMCEWEEVGKRCFCSYFIRLRTVDPNTYAYFWYLLSYFIISREKNIEYTQCIFSFVERMQHSDGSWKMQWFVETLQSFDFGKENAMQRMLFDHQNHRIWLSLLTVRMRFCSCRRAATSSACAQVEICLINTHV